MFGGGVRFCWSLRLNTPTCGAKSAQLPGHAQNRTKLTSSRNLTSFKAINFRKNFSAPICSVFIRLKLFLLPINRNTRILSFFSKLSSIKLPLWFRKAGRLWCGGARETHLAASHNSLTPSKTKKFLKSPCFLRSWWYSPILFTQKNRFWN